MSFDVRNIGLRDVLVADTLICKIEPDSGTLLYRGYNILDLVNNSTFVEVVYLLLYHKLPIRDELNNIQHKMNSYRKLPKYLEKFLHDIPTTSKIMSVLQSSITLIECYECEKENSIKESRDTALRIISVIPTIIAYLFRIKNKLSTITPLDYNFAANFLYMLSGKKPEYNVSKIFDECLILHAEHSFNASTFTAREVASTGASMYASISAAMAALSGKLHGGASEKVMDMIEDIGDFNQVQEWIINQIDAGKRIMGIGHAVYKNVDPRATILKDRSKQLSKIKGESKWLDITQKIEEIATSELKERKGLELYPNVDLYTPSIYSLLNIQKDLFIPIFAMARSAGWSAHIIEEKLAEAQPKPVLYRPKAKYIGQYCGDKECLYTPISDRK